MAYLKNNVFYICNVGIGFPYKGDEVIVLWPWRWKFRRWKVYWLLSIDFESGFCSFAEIDKEWRDYFRACRILLKGETK